MDKLVTFHHLNPPLFQSSPTQRPCTIEFPTCLAVGFTDLANEAPVMSASVPPRDSFGFISLDDLMAEVKTLSSVKAIHAQMIKTLNKGNLHAMGKFLIDHYMEFGDFRSAAMVFFVGFSRNYIMWNSFLDEFRSFGGDPFVILEVFDELHSKGVVFNGKTLTIILKFCACLREFFLGVEIHATLIKRGFDSDVYLSCALIKIYGSCWDVESANNVFDEISDRKDILWNEVIMVNLKNERWIEALELFHSMKHSFAQVNSNTIAKVVQACGKVRALREGKQIHAYVLRYGLESNLPICNSFITMYSKNDRLELGRRVFNSMADRNLSSWNSIISSYAAFGHLNDALHLFDEMGLSKVEPDIVTWNCLLSGHSRHHSCKSTLKFLLQMQISGFDPNSSSITSVLQAVINSDIYKVGKEIHGYVLRHALDYDVYVGTSLLNMYVKNNSLTKAGAVFNMIKDRNIFVWNSLISGYSFKGQLEEAEELLHQMKKEGLFKPDLVTWNSLVTGYSMKGQNDEALAVINRIKKSGLTPNVVSWTALISGSSQNGNYLDSLEFFVQMQEEGVRPNSATTCSLLRAFAGLSLLRKGEEVHSASIRHGFVEDVQVATGLIDMYNKSGNLKNALEVFRRIKNKTIASWNCMIMGYATHGQGKEAILLFKEMLEEGVWPDSITFTAILSGCKNSGLVDEGWKFFDRMMTDYDIIQSIEHYSCMVDLLGRAGYLDEAWDFVETMPFKPDATIWGALLASSRIHGNVEFAETAANNLFQLEPNNSANYVLLMNLYASSDRWEDVENLKDLMSFRRVKTRQVWSWVQIGQAVHVFTGEGKPHPDIGRVYFELYQIVSEIKKLGYVGESRSVYQRIEEVEKEKVLLSHTEKLAITYGLIKSRGNEAIRVIKNTRICSDCHTAAKYISLARRREILLKDGVRFHHFREGKCSCNDYW